MKNVPPFPVVALTLLLAFTLCGVPQMLEAQATPQSQPTSQTQNSQTTPDSAMPDPSRGPLQPAQQLPESAGASKSQQGQGQSNSQNSQNSQAPVGAAAAPAGPVAGGAASKPAGSAIAPAKQRNTRALLIKVGAIAAAGVAVGTIYALSRGTPSVPPGASTVQPQVSTPGR